MAKGWMCAACNRDLEGNLLLCPKCLKAEQEKAEGVETKTHKLRFYEELGAPGKFRKVHEVTVVTKTNDSTADQMVTWVNTIMIDKDDIIFLMGGD